MKKLITSILIATTFFFSFAPYSLAKAQSTNWYNQGPADWFLKVYDDSNPNEIFGERYTAAQVQWVVYGFGSLIINTLTFNNTQLTRCLIGATSGSADVITCYDAVKSMIKLIADGSTASTGRGGGLADNSPESLWTMVFSDKSISGVTYFKNTLNKLKLVPEVKAAVTDSGAGFAALSPISSIWAGFRNIAYMIFVIVTVVFAFMIMFRVKLSPQVAISIQSALPKIVISLILVTFSFAIAGLAVDLTYVITGFFSLAWTASGLSSASPTAIFNIITGNPAFVSGWPVVGSLLGGLVTLILYFVVYWLYLLLAIVLVLTSSVLSLNFLTSIVSILLLVMLVVLILIIFINMFKVSYLFLKTLAQIYLLVIIAPLQITAGTIIPSLSFSKWFRQLMANLLVFPAIGILFNFAFFFITKALGFIVGSGFGFTSLGNALVGDFFTPLWGSSVDWGTAQAMATSHGWSPPFMGVAPSSLPIAFIMLSIMCIIAMPKVGDILKGAIMGERINFGTGIGEALGPFGSAATAAQKLGSEAAVGVGAGYATRGLDSYYKWLQQRGADQGGWGRLVGGLTGAVKKMGGK